MREIAFKGGDGERPWAPWRWGLWLAFFLLYALTTARGVLPADSGEFQLGAAEWGILHPPGYPLYTIVGALWVRLLPLGTIPFRLNLLSAVLAATTLLLTAEAVHTWARNWGLGRVPATGGGVGAVLLLGAAPTFWAQATTANIRMPTLLFTAWGFLSLARYAAALRADDDVEGSSNGSSRSRALLALALAVGLGVGHHPSLVFPATGWLLYLLLLHPTLPLRPRLWWKPALLAALAWLLPQLYLPLRGGMENVALASPEMALDTWEGFWGHVLARGFAGDMFAFASPSDLALRLPLLGTLFRLQFPRFWLALALAGWIWLAVRRWRLALGLLLSWGVHTFVTLTYRAPQTVEYLMPAYLPVVLAFGLGLAALARRAEAPTPSRVGGVLVRGVGLLLPALLVLRVASHLPDFLTLARDESVRDRVAPLLEEAPPGGLILADWRWATPLYVLQAVEGLGAGVEVRYVTPVPGLSYEEVWRERAEAAGDRPLLATHRYHWAEWEFAPVGGGFRLFRRPLAALPAGPAYRPLEADLGPVQLLGYKVRGRPRPGATFEVQLAWRATGPQAPPPSFTVRLFDPEGNFLAHTDRFLGSDSAEGEVRFTELTLRLPPGGCAEAVRPAVGVYTVVEGAFETLGEASLPDLAVDCDTPALPTGRRHPGLVLGAGPLLRGVDYDVRGEQITAYLHFCGPGRALVVRGHEREVYLGSLRPGACRTVALPVALGANGRPAIGFARPDGGATRLLAWPLPRPGPGERYVPFGDEMVLVGAGTAERGGHFVVDLRWRSVRPLVKDYAVSARLRAADGSELGVPHDMQPALSAIPTLKWVVGGLEVLDPHVFAPPEVAPGGVTVTVYERFRLTPLLTSEGDGATFPVR